MMGMNDLDRNNTPARVVLPAKKAENGVVRETGRDSLFMQGQLHIPDHDGAITVRVRNLSAGGVMVDFVGDFPEGTPLQIELRNIGLVTGHVAWSSANHIGMAFDAPIDPLSIRRTANVRHDDLFRPVTLGKYDNYKRSL